MHRWAIEQLSTAPKIPDCLSTEYTLITLSLSAMLWIETLGGMLEEPYSSLGTSYVSELCGNRPQLIQMNIVWADPTGSKVSVALLLRMLPIKNTPRGAEPSA